MNTNPNPKIKSQVYHHHVCVRALWWIKIQERHHANIWNHWMVKGQLLPFSLLPSYTYMLGQGTWLAVGCKICCCAEEVWGMQEGSEWYRSAGTDLIVALTLLHALYANISPSLTFFIATLVLLLTFTFGNTQDMLWVGVREQQPQQEDEKYYCRKWSLLSTSNYILCFH